MIWTMTAAVQRAKMLTIVAVLVIGGLAPVRPARADINEQVAQLDLSKATLKDVLRIFGEPQSYSWEGKTLTRDSLPRTYMLAYPNDFSVLMNAGRVGELRFTGLGAGYAYQGKLRVGSSLEEVLAVVGQPASTVEGGHVGGQDGVLYKDVDGKKGDCYYSRADQHVRLFFQDYKVVGLCLMGRQQRGDLDAGGKLAKLSEQPAGPVTFPKIDRRPAPCDFERGSLEAAPKYDPKNSDAFQVDLRSYDLSRLDLREAAVALAHANFDDRTVWPAPERLPSGFDRQRMVELAKNPGLRVHSLHAQGITGRGVGIAIIDNPLLTDHQEYAERLRLYEEDNVPSEGEAHMHGPAVASIAVGKTVGVAPEADLYYIGRWVMDREPGTGGAPSVNSQYDAQAIQRILQINEQLPADRKIRVISISFGWEFGQRGYLEAAAAARKAKAAGMLVICSSTEEVHGFKFHGLGRDLMSDPNDFASYRLTRWGTEMYASHDRLLVPMDARATASPTGKNEYAFYSEGGWSWSIPYIAGMYALTAQVEPKITPERFWALAMKTGRTVETKDGEKTISLGPILDPVQLIEAIRRGDLSDATAVAAELAKYSAPSPRVPPQAWVSNDRMPEDFAARLARLDIDNASRKDVIEQLGKPASYVLGNEVLDANNLPSRYAMVYPAGVQVIMSAERIGRITVLAPGYLFRNKVQVGTGQAEVFEVLGPPRKTVENAKGADVSRGLEDGVLYQDFDGVKGSCLYRDRAQGVLLYFEESRVRQMMLLPKSR
jgi:hypothetical protein